MEDEYMTLNEAKEYLGVSRVKISQLVRDGKLKTSENPLDSRSKLVKSEEVKKLKANSRPATKLEKKPSK
jgi:excisionase family DNA binding protein